MPSEVSKLLERLGGMTELIAENLNKHTEPKQKFIDDAEYIS